MKTTVVMTRKMGNFEVKQRTSDAMFNATDLLRQWNKVEQSKHGKSHIKNVADFLRRNSTNEFVETMIVDEELHTKNAVYLKSRGKYGGTWMHPYLFIDFAMWINPSFKLKVIKFVHDQLIQFRHSAGDNYNILSAAVSRLPNKDYKEVAIGLQWLIFNKRGKELRQNATPQQLKELAETEKQLAFSIDMGFIRTQAQLMHTLRQMHRNKYQKNHHLLQTA